MVDTVERLEAEDPSDERPRRGGRFSARRTLDGFRLYWWVELLAILAFYSVYSTVRNANEGGAGHAFANAQRLIGWERGLGIYSEERLQSAALHLRSLVVGMNYLYGSLHFVVTAGTIIWLFRRHTDDYPLWRNTLAATTGLALVGFITWPLMPPRLLPQTFGFVDTLARYPTFWSFDSGAMSKISNQFAAMPSLHVAWSTYCAVALVPRLRTRAARVALALYPVLTITAIVLTGNHYFLDALGGWIVLSAGYGVARMVTRAGRSRAAVAAGV